MHLAHGQPTGADRTRHPHNALSSPASLPAATLTSWAWPSTQQVIGTVSRWSAINTSASLAPSKPDYSL